MRIHPLHFVASCLLAPLLGGLVSAGEPIALTGRSPYFGPMKGTLTVTPKGDVAEVIFKATFERGASWTLRGEARLRKGQLSCDLFSFVGASGVIAGTKVRATHKLTVNREGSRIWGKCSGKDGTTWFREALSVTAHLPTPDPTKGSAKERVRSAVQLLRRLDKNGDGIISGRRYGNELDATKDPLTKAVFDFVNFGNYSGQTSVLGSATRGDVQEGGLGLGYTTRPKHYTSHGTVTEGDLSAGVQDLAGRLTGSSGPGDLAQRDLEKILQAEAKTRGGLKGKAPARYQAVHEAVERLLDHVAKKTGEKELATRTDGARLTHAELLASLDPESLEGFLAKVVIGEGEEQWMEFFKYGLRNTARDEQTEERGQVGSILQHYLLVIGKRARQTGLVRTIESHLPARSK